MPEAGNASGICLLFGRSGQECPAYGNCISHGKGMDKLEWFQGFQGVQEFQGLWEVGAFHLSCEGEGEHGDANARGFRNHFCEGEERGPGGDYVIDDEYVLVGQSVGTVEPEDVSHVVFSLFMVEMCLRRVVHHPLRRIVHHRDARLPRQSLSQEITLIVSPFPFLLSCQRHRNDGVDAVEEVGVLLLLYEHPRQVGCHLRPVEILDVVEDASRLLPFVEEHARGTLNGYLSPEKPFDDAVLFPTLVVDAVEGAQAARTDFLLVQCQSLAAHAAVAREEEIKERVHYFEI